MRTGHYLFHVLEMAPTSMAKVCAQWMVSLRPGSLLLTVLRCEFGVILTK